MSTRKILAANLRRLRKDNALSQEALANEIGVDRSYISSLERGVYSATIDMLDKIAKAFKTKAYVLIMEPGRRL